MKKGPVLALVLIMMIGLMACERSDVPDVFSDVTDPGTDDVTDPGTDDMTDPGTGDVTDPVDTTEDVIDAGIQGVDDVTLSVGDVFDPFDGVVVIDANGHDVTSVLIILGLEHLELDEGRTTRMGEFIIVYIADTDDARYEASRAVVIEASNDSVDTDDPDALLASCQNPILGDWIITWCDEFTGEGDNLNAQGVDLDRWGFQLGTGVQYGLNGWGNNEAQYYREENARVENGRLIIEAKRENYGGMAYTSARLYTKPTFSQTYGRFEAKIRLPIGEGLWPAYWMMPQDDVYGGWAASGEIDIMEARGRLPNQSIGALHFGAAWPNNVHTHEVYHFPTDRNIADFNVYAIEWEEDEIRWYVNDVLIKQSTWWYTQGHDFPAPFDQDFYMLLNLAIGGTFDGGRVPPDSLFDSAVEMEVEYVRVYERQDD